eukprot:5548183-Pyramimonas_sp.AAC.1
MCQIGCGYAMRAVPLGPSWSCLRGYGTCDGCAESDAGTSCGLSRWGFRFCFLWGHDSFEGCARSGAGAHADCVTRSFG